MRKTNRRKNAARPTIESLEGRQVLSAVVATGDAITLRTRRDYDLISPQGIAPLTALPSGSSADSAFTIVEVKGNGDGLIQDGERVGLRTPRGMTVNTFDSRGPAYPIGFSDLDNDGSDQLLTIRKAVPDGDPDVHDGDPILLVTRYGYFWNSWDSRGSVQAIPVANTTPGESDEIFTVVRRDPAELTETPVDSPFTYGQAVSLSPTNLPSFYLRHRAFELHADPAEDYELYRNDSTFIPRPGLADPSLVSFESVNFPGRFLRHRNLEFFLDPDDGSELYRMDATFRVGTALGGGGVTLESFNFPGWFVRHRDFRLRLDPQDGSDQLRLDSVFAVKPPLAEPTTPVDAAPQTPTTPTAPVEESAETGDDPEIPTAPVVVNPPVAAATTAFGASQWNDPTTHRGFMIGSGTILNPTLRAKAIEELKSWNVNLLRLELGVTDKEPLPTQARRIAAQVAAVTSEFSAAGIGLIVDLHPINDGGAVSKALAKSARASFIEAWRYLATTFKDDKAIVGYDLLNEPGAALAGQWSRLVKDTVKAIRGIDKNKAVVIESIGGNPEKLKDLPIFKGDPHVVYSFHMYHPDRYTHQGIGGRPFGVKLTDLSESKLSQGKTLRRVAEDMLDKVWKWQRDNHTRVFVGEFSVNRNAPDATEYLDLCLKRFEKYHWDWTYHAYSTASEPLKPGEIQVEEDDVWNIKLGPEGNGGLDALKSRFGG